MQARVIITVVEGIIVEARPVTLAEDTEVHLDF
jgi:hypothetical protein